MSQKDSRNEEENQSPKSSRKNAELEALKIELAAVQERLSKLERNFDESLVLQKLRLFEDQIKKMETQVSDLTQKGEKAIDNLRDNFRKVWSDLKNRSAQRPESEETPPPQQ